MRSARRSRRAASSSRIHQPAPAGNANSLHPTDSLSSESRDAKSSRTMPPIMTAPHIKTPLPGPKAKALIERDATYVSPSYTRGYPLVMARGEGAVVEDVDGNL